MVLFILIFLEMQKYNKLPYMQAHRHANLQLSENDAIGMS
jgi:hypothetical protein